MNKLAKNFVMLGAIIIAVLLLVLYFVSMALTKNIESRMNKALSEAKIQIDNSGGKYAIHGFDFEPFVCSGLLDYDCKSKKISIYVNNPLTKETYENVRLEDINIDLQDIKSKKHLSIGIQTKISYPNIERFFGDSQDNVIVFLNHNAQALLPSHLECVQDYLLDEIYEEMDPNSSLISLKTTCDFNSPLINTNIVATNIFNPSIIKSHILSLFYEVAKANSGTDDMFNDSHIQIQNPQDPKKSNLILVNIPHQLMSLKFSLKSNQTFKEFLANDKTLSEEQKQNLANFEGGLSLIRIGMSVSSKLFASYFNGNGEKILIGIIDLVQNKIKDMTIELNAKRSIFRPLEAFYIRNMIGWLTFLNENYNTTISINGSNGVGDVNNRKDSNISNNAKDSRNEAKKSSKEDSKQS